MATLSVFTGAALLCGSATHAGDVGNTVSIVVQQGDVFAPHGTVSNINDIFVNDNGDWLVDASLTDGTASQALIVNGTVWIAAGDPLPPSSVSSLFNLLKHMNVHGDISFRPSLTGDPDSGIYLNMTPLVLEDDISTAPEFSANTPYTGFFRARVNDNGDVFVVASVDDPNIDSTTDRALVWLNYDAKTMTVTEEVLAKEGDAAPGTELDVVFSDFGTNAERHAINNNREAIYVASLTGGGVPTTSNAGIYINDMLVVRKGDESPVAGATYNNISTSTRTHMNINRDYLFIGTLSNQTGIDVLVRGDGDARNVTEILQTEGTAAPNAGGETITSFGTGVQPHITDNGDVLWYAQLSGDTATNQALYINDQVLLRKGVTSIDGQIITTVLGTTSSSNGIGSTLVVSPNGQYAITRSVFDAGPRAALLIEFEQASCLADIVSSDTFQPPPDGQIDGADLAFLLGEWGANPGSPADIVTSKTFQPPPDGLVDGADLAFLLGDWGLCE